MAPALYDNFAQKLLDSTFDNLDTADVRVCLIDTADYTFSAAHDFLDDVPVAARVATLGSALANTTIAGGLFDCDNYVFPLVTGDPAEALIYFVHTGSDATAKLICFVDGISVTPNGQNINVTVHATNGIFNLTP